MTIRPETPEDYETIDAIHLAAFATCPYSRLTEHLIVRGLRADAALTVSLVAEVDGAVVGHIAFSAAWIDGRGCGWYVLGPIGVLPALQRQGVGKALMGAGLEALRGLGADGCVLVGDPGYYTRFGFSHDPGLVFEGVPAQYCLRLALGEKIPRGIVTHHAAFLVEP